LWLLYLSIFYVFTRYSTGSMFKVISEKKGTLNCTKCEKKSSVFCHSSIIFTDKSWKTPNGEKNTLFPTYSSKTISYFFRFAAILPSRRLIFTDKSIFFFFSYIYYYYFVYFHDSTACALARALDKFNASCSPTPFDDCM